MSTFQRFAIGGLGGLLPILVSLLSFDIASCVDHWDTLTLGNYIGYAIKVFVLIALGGIIAALNNDILKPLVLMQLGVAAPALITSYINGTGVSGPTEKTSHASSSVAVISSAYAAEASGRVPIVLAGFLGDVIQGATVPLPKIQRQQQQQRQQPQQQQQQRQQQGREEPAQQQRQRQ